MNLSDVLGIIKYNLTNLQERDGDLIDAEAKEENINHHFANYINRHIRRNGMLTLRMDLEHDQHGGFEKKIRIRGRNVRIRPDAIAHQRGHDEKNFLAIECKKGNSSAHDRDKIIGLMQPPYNYKYGAMVSYLPNRDYFRFSLFYHYQGYIYFTEHEVAK